MASKVVGFSVFFATMGSCTLRNHAGVSAAEEKTKKVSESVFPNAGTPVYKEHADPNGKKAFHLVGGYSEEKFPKVILCQRFIYYSTQYPNGVRLGAAIQQPSKESENICAELQAFEERVYYHD